MFQNDAEGGSTFLRFPSSLPTKFQASIIIAGEVGKVDDAVFLGNNSNPILDLMVSFVACKLKEVQPFNRPLVLILCNPDLLVFIVASSFEDFSIFQSRG